MLASTVRPAEGSPAGRPLQRVLSPRQLAVARLATCGWSDRQIAERLCIQQRTVQGYLQEIYRRLGCHNRVEMAMLVLLKGGISVSEVMRAVDERIVARRGE